MILANLPDRPSLAPYRNILTDEFTVAVNIVQVPGYHGSQITSYNIEIDDGKGGDFKELQGDKFNSLSMVGILSTNVTSGLFYRLRYRAKNAIGYGNYSDIGYILTASRPDKPTIISTTITSSNVVISWQMPYNRASLIRAAEIKILNSDGLTFS
jgi:hypothetical protein